MGIDMLNDWTAEPKNRTYSDLEREFYDRVGIYYDRFRNNAHKWPEGLRLEKARYEHNLSVLLYGHFESATDLQNTSYEDLQKRLSPTTNQYLLNFRKRTFARAEMISSTFLPYLPQRQDPTEPGKHPTPYKHTFALRDKDLCGDTRRVYANLHTTETDRGINVCILPGSWQPSHAPTLGNIQEVTESILSMHYPELPPHQIRFFCLIPPEFRSGGNEYFAEIAYGADPRKTDKRFTIEPKTAKPLRLEREMFRNSLPLENLRILFDKIADQALDDDNEARGFREMGRLSGIAQRQLHRRLLLGHHCPNQSAPSFA